MNATLKALGLGLVAALASGAFSTMSAPAETGGHFTSAAVETTVKGVEGGFHRVVLPVPGISTLECEKATYAATVEAESKTTESVRVTPTYEGCKRTGGTSGEIVVHVNGCTYVVGIGKKAMADNTVEIDCPEGNAIELTGWFCPLMVIPPQAVKGLSYGTIVENAKHSLTVGVTTNLAINFESPNCIVGFGTKHTITAQGGVTVSGYDAGGTQVDIAATGSED
jgi:hypothetical protein